MAALKGGDKLEAALREIAQKVSKPGTLRVGFLEGATYPDGTSVALVAASNEFGTKRIPPRPFFRNMIAAKSDEWAPAIGQLLPQNGYDAPKVLALAGDAIKGQLQQSIRDTNSPPLSPVTIEKKGFDKPLIETAHMIMSVGAEVK
ncbi:conserved hypothetical protein [Bradyrhizobium sp. STM 3843]|uniref:hypothetical protein n=1 Tax=Bradyrhizobium sp. STM 3843 TaxID=551947 RepID=UPI0002403022|nr:hypothetical protein [Bradyrhizobium sp. STM 3843]CCE07593.1 conserved hypothetical protein [Bradyrhizobium sp. STM 3843]